MSELTVTTHTVGSGADTITYDVRGDLASATAERPVLFLIGSPMDAVGFGSLASRFTDRPVVTYDPRGAGRNPTDTTPITAEQHADDLHRVIEALGVGPVDVFGSSGGAVNALAHAAIHPDDVLRVVAHEPPTAALLPDRDAVLAVCRDMRATYDREGSPPCDGQVHPVRDVRRAPSPRPTSTSPLPDPAMFGMPDEDDGSRTDPLMRNIPACNEYLPDVEALRALGDRLVIGRRRGVGTADGRPWRPLGRRGRSGPRRPSSPAATPASSAASTARPATPTASPPPCTPSSTEPVRARSGFPG